MEIPFEIEAMRIRRQMCLQWNEYRVSLPTCAIRRHILLV